MVQLRKRFQFIDFFLSWNGTKFCFFFNSEKYKNQVLRFEIVAQFWGLIF